MCVCLSTLFLFGIPPCFYIRSHRTHSVCYANNIFLRGKSFSIENFCYCYSNRTTLTVCHKILCTPEEETPDIIAHGYNLLFRRSPFAVRLPPSGTLRSYIAQVVFNITCILSHFILLYKTPFV